MKIHHKDRMFLHTCWFFIYFYAVWFCLSSLCIQNTFEVLKVSVLENNQGVAPFSSFGHWLASEFVL